MRLTATRYECAAPKLLSRWRQCELGALLETDS